MFLLSKSHGVEACFTHSDFLIQPACEGANLCSHVLGLMVHDKD